MSFNVVGFTRLGEVNMLYSEELEVGERYKIQAVRQCASAFGELYIIILENGTFGLPYVYNKTILQNYQHPNEIDCTHLYVTIEENDGDVPKVTLEKVDLLKTPIMIEKL